MQKKIIALFAVILFASFCTVHAGPWEDMAQLAKSIKQPSFPEKSFNIQKFGASEKN